MLDKLINVGRAAVRPIITLAFVGTFIGAFFTGDISDVPEWLQVLGVSTIAFWYASRAPSEG